MIKIIEKSIDELIPYENNTKLHPQSQIDTIKKSIEQFGFNDPIAIWGEGNLIIEGHGRLIAAKQLGISEVPCIRLDHLSDDERKAYTIAHNATSLNSGFDLEKLNAELASIDYDMAEFGLAEQIKEIEKEFAKEVIEDEVPEVADGEPTTQLGDIWQLGRHRLMCGDSTDRQTIEKLTSGAKVDMVFTDPPYGMSAVSKSGVLSKSYKTDILNDDTNEVAIDSFLLCKQFFKDAKQVWWGANYYSECLPSSECWIVWDKNNGESDQTDCELAWTNFRSVVRQFTLASEKINRVHPTQKPIKLIHQILNKFDKDKSFKCLFDGFGGSGSTLIACEQLNRTCYMMELDPKYVQVIIQRYIAFKGTSDDVYRINADGTKTKYEDIT